MSASGRGALDLRQRQRESAELPRQVLCAFDAAIRNEEPTDAVTDEMLGDEFNRHAGANEQRGVLLEACEELLCQVHGC